MRANQLMAALSLIPPDAEVFMSSDEEGNRITNVEYFGEYKKAEEDGGEHLGWVLWPGWTVLKGSEL